MILYHGTICPVEHPRILQTEIGRDFGFAFYTTDIQDQAERWALRKARIENRKKRVHYDAVVNLYEWDKECAGLQYKLFSDISMEWLEMIVQCRSNPAFQHGYDIVEGKIADDSVGETVSFVIQGIMRKEDALQRLKFEKINNQIAFCTERALTRLKFQKAIS